jgi:hypothetical protein
MERSYKFDLARADLKHYATLLTDAQMELMPELEVAFNDFWQGNPSEAEFASTMHGVVLSARMLYKMVKDPQFRTL